MRHPLLAFTHPHIVPLGPFPHALGRHVADHCSPPSNTYLSNSACSPKPVARAVSPWGCLDCFFAFGVFEFLHFSTSLFLFLSLSLQYLCKSGYILVYTHTAVAWQVYNKVRVREACVQQSVMLYRLYGLVICTVGSRRVVPDEPKVRDPGRCIHKRSDLPIIFIDLLTEWLCAHIAIYIYIYIYIYGKPD